MFMGRSTELKFLNHYYEQNGNHILVVYGQRGIGKTALLQQFISNKKSAYYVARACSEREQRYQWACELEEESLSSYPSYSEIFRRLLDSAAADKMVMVIDEFHHIVKNDELFLGSVVDFLKVLPSQKQVLFVMCTSASGWVENSMVKRIGSAALSINGLLKVREMRFDEICAMFPGYSSDSYVENFAILGGVPGLWNNFSHEYDTPDNIIHNILAKESRLHNELVNVYAEELREPAVYNTILAAMARGCNKLNDIHKHTGFSRAKISVYLKNLMELELVEKVFSFDTEGYADTQKGIYRISNTFVRFYFRFLFANETLLESLGAEEFFQKKIKDRLPSFVEEAYRRICRETIHVGGKVAGEWLGKSGNLDIVAKDSEGNLIVANCSYGRPMKVDDYEWLVFCAQRAKIKNASFRLYSESGFDEELKKLAVAGKVFLYQIKEN